jgi:integrase/recombinase XerD
MFFTLYSMGLRLGEGLRIRVGDIDAERARLHVRNAKGNKDRFVPLPIQTLDVLRRFWRVHQHPTLLFPNRKRGLKHAHLADRSLDMGGVQVAMVAVVREMRLKHRFLLLQNRHTPHPCG